MSIVLLGRDLLDNLGFKFDRYVADNYEALKNIDSIQKMRVCSYNGVMYGEQSDDHITTLVDLSAQFGDDTLTERKEALHEGIKEARRDDFLEEGLR